MGVSTSFASESPKLIQIGGFDLLGFAVAWIAPLLVNVPTLGSQGTIVEARFITSATYYKVPIDVQLPIAAICINLRII